MSTITTTPSVAKTLLTTITTCDRKYDLRSVRGKNWKELSNDPALRVVVGVADYLFETPQYDDDYNVVSSTYEAIKYNVLHVSLVAEFADIRTTAEAYLREVAPTRVERDKETYTDITLPNIVRIATDKLYVEGRVDKLWSRIDDGFKAFQVASFTIDPETDTLVTTWDIVDDNHNWEEGVRPNGEYYPQYDIRSLSTYKSLVEKVEEKRRSIEEGKRTQALVTECVEQGTANSSLSYDRSVKAVTEFVEKFESPIEGDAPRYPVKHAFDVAYETALHRVAKYYLGVIGKTNWEVSSNTFSSGRRGWYRTEDERLAERPKFIDEAHAYALTIEWYIKDDWDVTPESAKAEVIKRFTDLVRGYYR